MQNILVGLFVLVPVLVSAADAPVPQPQQPTRQELALSLQAVQMEKEKFMARYNWGQTMMDEAGRLLPDITTREQILLQALKQIDDQAKAAKDPKPESKAEK